MAIATHTGAILSAQKDDMTHAPAGALTKRLQAILGVMSAQFLLGLALATVADYDASTHTGNHAIHQFVLGLHMLLALGLVIGSIAILAAARKFVQQQIVPAVVGLIAILVSVVCGIGTLMFDSHEWYTFFMGAGFIVAISIYGAILGYLQFHHHSLE